MSNFATIVPPILLMAQAGPDGPVGGVGDDAAPGRAVQKALLHQERFVHVFDGIDGFADGGGNGVEADGTAAEIYR